MNSVEDAVEMPAALKVRTSRFDPRHRQSAEARTSGAVDVWDTARPFWELEFASGPMSPAVLQTWRGWLAGLKGSARSFLAWDKWADRPVYFDGAADLDGVSFDSTTATFDATDWTFDGVKAPWGEPELTAIDAEAGTINTRGWISGTQLQPGDPLSWFDGRNWTRVVIGGATITVVGGDGLANGLTVEPYLTAAPGLAGYILPIPLRVEKACCEMVMKPNSAAASLSHDQIGTVSFQAAQIVRRANT